MANNLAVTGNLTVGGTLVVTGTTNLGAAADTVLVTNFNADKVDGADLDTDGTLAANSDVKIPSQKAVKTYVGTVDAARKTYVDDADALKANDNAVVKLTGNQTVAGVKTFSSQPVMSAGNKVNGFIHSTSTTHDVFFDALAPFVPNVGNTMLVTGVLGAVGAYTIIAAYAERLASGTIRIYGTTLAGVASYYEVFDGGSTVACGSLAW